MELIELSDYKSIGKNGERKMYGLYACPICGEQFECIVANVRRGKTTKCRLCANRATAQAKANKASIAFIEKAIGIHGDLYDYSNVVYVNTNIKVVIACRKHGVFEQTPHNHLTGHGCDACARDDNNISKRQAINSGLPIIVYYIHILEHNLWKVGCTSKSLHERFSQDGITIDILYSKEYLNSSEGYQIESYLLGLTKEHKYTGIQVLRGGNTELRTKPIPNIAYEIEKAEMVLGIQQLNNTKD